MNNKDLLIEKWIAMLRVGHSKDEIKRECLEYCFRIGVGVMSIDAIIFKSMDLYAEIYKHCEVID